MRFPDNMLAAINHGPNAVKLGELAPKVRIRIDFQCLCNVLLGLDRVRHVAIFMPPNPSNNEKSPLIRLSAVKLFFWCPNQVLPLFVNPLQGILAITDAVVGNRNIVIGWEIRRILR